MATDEIPCYGDFCKGGAEFCDVLSRFCISCTKPPWSERCFTTDHIPNCTAICRALKLENGPKSAPDIVVYPPWLIALISILLIISITVLVIVCLTRRRPKIRELLTGITRAVLSCCGLGETKVQQIDENGNDEETGMMDDQHDDQHGCRHDHQHGDQLGDQRPVQVTSDDANTSDNVTGDNPKFGPTTLKPHEEAKLL
ncbi:uncharacterized protein LOC117337535 [Pecten maximus]|uniref:uncharacterized protein LOC117337535 n=1 Tax=Pecten maximus TaxID=6579 RepID=UPI0014582D1A|nr:uncharacterized protein LOC117337535 [Pecten maximus]